MKDVMALGSNQYVAANQGAAQELATVICEGIRADWNTTVELLPASKEELPLGVQHYPERLLVRASGDFARGAFPERDQGQASYRATIWIGSKPTYTSA